MQLRLALCQSPWQVYLREMSLARIPNLPGCEANGAKVALLSMARGAIQFGPERAADDPPAGDALALRQGDNFSIQRRRNPNR